MTKTAQQEFDEKLDRSIERFLEHKGIVKLLNDWGFFPKVERLLVRLDRTLKENAESKSDKIRKAVSDLRSIVLRQRGASTAPS